MSDFLTDFLASILSEEGCPNPTQVAARAAAEINGFNGADRRAFLREQIRRDGSTDYKLLTSRYHCSPQTVYRAWAEILPARETK